MTALCLAQKKARAACDCSMFSAEEGDGCKVTALCLAQKKARAAL